MFEQIGLSADEVLNDLVSVKLNTEINRSTTVITHRDTNSPVGCCVTVQTQPQHLHSSSESGYICSDTLYPSTFTPGKDLGVNGTH